MSDSAERPGKWPTVRANVRRWAVPFVAIEWAFEWVAYWLGRLAILDVAKALGTLSIVWAAISYALSGSERTRAASDQRKSKHYQAWEVVLQAENRRVGAGRKDALQDLAKDSVSLVGVNLDNAALDSIDLGGADLSSASLRGARLRYALLDVASLSASSLNGADLVAANLEGAQLNSADLRGAMLTFANLGGATLYTADLRFSVVGDNLRGVTQLITPTSMASMRRNQ